ncbi:MAG TPA: divalent metal cation transporter [Chthonomonadaceae bacterium]|nr:divalent metal cation transporter [Chthonomonadaceae bacterium]
MTDTTTAARPEAPPRRSLRQWLRVMGPGVITGAAGDDPAGIGTYSQVGAQNGTSLLWLMLLATPMLQVVQVTCAKLGVVSKQGLSGILKEHYGLKVAAIAAALTALANIATIGADIAGIGAAFELLFRVKWQWFVIPVTLAIWYFQVYMDYGVIRKALLLLALTLLTYILAGFMAKPDWGTVLRDTFLPHIEMNLAFFSTAVGLLGTTISPYMYYFQAAQVVEENTPVKKLDDVTVDTTTGMIFTNIVSYFIILATAATLHIHGKQIETAADAARALEPFAGEAAKYLFAAGMIGAGLLAVPVLAASTAAMIGETAGWRIGLNKSVTRARGFYLALSVALLFGAAITLSGIHPMKALFYSQILSGVVAPALLFLIFRLSRREEVLGERVNTPVQQAWGWLTVAVMALSVALMAWGWITGQK